MSSISPEFGCPAKSSGGAAGVASLNTLTGALSIVPGNASITVTPSGNQIALTANLAGGAVQSLNGQSGVITLSGTGASTVTNTGPAFTIDTTLPAIVNTVNSASGAVTITGTGASTVSTVGNAVTVDTTLPAIVNTVNSASGAVTITGTGASTVSTVGNAVTVDTVLPAIVNTVNSASGAVTITGTGASTVSTVGNAVTVDTVLPSIVNTLNSLNGAVTITAGTDIGFTTVGNDITINNTATPGAAGVASFNTLTGAVTITAGTDIGFTTVGNDITINNTATPGGGGVTSVNLCTGIVDIQGGTGITVSADTGTGIITIDNTKTPDVITLNGLDGDLNCISSDGSILISGSGTDIDFTVVGIPPVSGVTSINTVTGVLNITSNSIVVTGDNIAKTVDLALTRVETLNGISDTISLISNDSSLSISPGLGNINLQLNDIFTLTCIINCTSQTATASAYSIAPNTTSYFDLFPQNPPYDVLSFLPLRSHIYASINAPYVGNPGISANTLSYGFSWSTPPTLPPTPTSLSFNVNSLSGTSGIIGTAKLTSAELAIGTNTQLYLVVSNTSSTNTYTISELPNHILFTFTNSV